MTKGALEINPVKLGCGSTSGYPRYSGHTWDNCVSVKLWCCWWLVQQDDTTAIKPLPPRQPSRVPFTGRPYSQLPALALRGQMLQQDVKLLNQGCGGCLGLYGTVEAPAIILERPVLQPQRPSVQGTIALKTGILLSPYASDWSIENVSFEFARYDFWFVLTSWS